MKIESVQSIVTGGAHFVKIVTDTGITGWGQSACWGYPEASHAIVEKFRDYLTGQDPLRIEHHWQMLYRMGPFRGSALGGAVSAVDIALWDIKGQHFDAPIWQLLGGKCRERVRLHLLFGGDSPDECHRNAKAGLEMGFTALKLDPIPINFGDLSQAALIAETAARVEAVRDAVKNDADIIIELHRRLTPLQALPVIDALTRYFPLFIEDPIQIDSIVSQAEIARRMNVPIANGERLHTIWEFRELLTSGGSQYVRPDLGLSGGITHVKKIAAIAESYHSAVVTHNFLGPVLTAAAVHLDISIPNFVVQEFSLFDEGDAAQAFNSSLRRIGGYMELPQAPGLGVGLKDDVADIRLTPVASPLHNSPLRNDGSVLFAV
jgi:galactonate dehydratase